MHDDAMDLAELLGGIGTELRWRNTVAAEPALAAALALVSHSGYFAPVEWVGSSVHQIRFVCSSKS